MQVDSAKLPTMELNKLLTREQVAEILNVSPSTVQALYMGKELFYYKVRRQVRIPYFAVLAYLDGVPVSDVRRPEERPELSTDPPTPSMFNERDNK